MPSKEHEPIEYHFVRPEEISEADFQALHDLISSGASVGMSWARDNLRHAFLIGYAATEKDRIVGCMVLKHPKRIYLEKIRHATGLDLSGFLERGYLSVKESFRGRGIAYELIKGLIERAQGKKMFITTKMDNEPVVHLTRKHGMRLAGRFVNERTGNEIGIFVNHPV